MKFKNKLKRKRTWNKIKYSIYDKFLREPFYVYYYKDMMKRFVDDDLNELRMYYNSYTYPDNSFKQYLDEYNKKFSVEFSDMYYPDAYEILLSYIKSEIDNYIDLSFSIGEDEEGNYFEIKLKN